MATSISHLKPITLACGAMLLGTFTVPLAPALAAETPTGSASVSVAPGDETQQTQSLSWGIRPSFVSYVGGHHAIGDGVAENNGIYTFPTTSITGDERHLDIRGKGFVQFAAHCTHPQDLATCALNMTLANPKLVLDPQGQSTLTYTVTTRNYQSGQVEGPHEVVMATLGLAGATQTTQGNHVTWTNITANLTKDGAHAFSDFYQEGAPLAPVSLSYIGKPLSLESGDFRIGPSWDSRADITEVNRVFAVGNRLVHAVGQKYGYDPVKLTTIDPETMQEISSTTLTTSRSVPMAADSAAGILYVYNSDTGALEKIGLDDKGAPVRLGALSKTLEISGEPFEMGFDPATRTLAVLSLGKNGAAWITYVGPDGAVETHELPRPETISPRLTQLLAEGKRLQSNDYYGDPYVRYARSLVPLSDGSFLYAPGSYVEDPEGNLLHRGYLLHFKRGQDPVEEVPQSAPANAPGIDLRGLATDGQNILRWNVASGAYSATQRLNYTDGTFTVSKKSGAPNEGAGEIAEMLFDGDKAVTIDAAHGRLIWSTPDGTTISTMPLPGLAKTNQENLVATRLASGDLIIPTAGEDSGGTRRLHLLRLIRTAPATTTPAPAPEVAPTPTTPPEEPPAPAPAPDKDAKPAPAPDKPNPPAETTPINQPAPPEQTTPVPDKPTPPEQATPSPDVPSPKVTPETKPITDSKPTEVLVTEAKDQSPVTDPSTTPEKDTVTPASAEATAPEPPSVLSSTDSLRPAGHTHERSERTEQDPGKHLASGDATPQASSEDATERTSASKGAAASASTQRAQAAGALARTGAENVDMYLATGVAAVAGGILLTRQARYRARHARKSADK